MRSDSSSVKMALASATQSLRATTFAPVVVGKARTRVISVPISSSNMAAKACQAWPVTM
jgi:hypothetical protein